MTTITVDPGTVTHTLPDHVCGVNMGVYFYNDMATTAYRDLFADLGAEIFRGFTEGRPISYGFYPALKAFLVHMQDRLGDRFAAMVGTPTMPSPQPASSPAAPVSTLAGFSIAEHRDYYRSLVNLGVNVKWWQYVNEPHLNAVDHEGNGIWPGTPWFGPGTPPFGSLADRLKCNDWVTIRHRDVSAAYHQELGEADCKVFAPSEANISGNSGFNLVKRFLLGQIHTSGVASPGPNIPYLDGLTVHSYRGFVGETEQEKLNQIFWDDGGTEASYLEAPTKGAFKAPLRHLREILDANGGAELPIGIDEGGSNARGTNGALANVAEAIAFCQIPGMAYLITHSFGRSTPADEQLLGATDIDGALTAANAKPTARYYALRDVWGRYMRTAKTQVLVTVNGSGKTSGSNPVDNVVAVAGRAGDTTLLMVANLNLSSAENVTWNLGPPFTLAAGEFRLLEGSVSAPLPVRLVSQSATTVTLGWDPVPGAAGYRFTSEKQARPSHTWDGSRSTVRFAKGSAWYRVEALDSQLVGEYRAALDGTGQP